MYCVQGAKSIVQNNVEICKPLNLGFGLYAVKTARSQRRSDRPMLLRLDGLDIKQSFRQIKTFFYLDRPILIEQSDFLRLHNCIQF
jgi:hypothetical protein